MYSLFKKVSIVFFTLGIVFFQFNYFSFAQAASDKPVFVEISTQWCYACNLLRPTIADRPSPAVIIDRPSEVKFWEIVEKIPLYAYYQYYILPECTGTTNLLCSNRLSNPINQIDTTKQPVTVKSNSVVKNGKEYKL